MKLSTIFLSTLGLCIATPTLSKELVENDIENKEAILRSVAGSNGAQFKYAQYQPQNQYATNTNRASNPQSQYTNNRQPQYTNNGQYSQSCSASQCSNHEQRLLLLEAHQVAVAQALNQFITHMGGSNQQQAQLQQQYQQILQQQQQSIGPNTQYPSKPNPNPQQPNYQPNPNPQQPNYQQQAQANTRLYVANQGNPNKGILMMQVNGNWGTVCDDSFSQREADVACRAMQYDGALSFANVQQSTGYHAPAGTNIVMDDVNCRTSTAASLTDCQYNPKSNCQHNEDIVLECFSQSHVQPNQED